MKQSDRLRLTAALREHVAAIASDLRAQMRAPGATRAAAVQLHKDEAVGDDFDVWTDLLSRRAAVLWVLKSVYVRVLEDRGLVTPGRLLDPEAQQLFEKLAPNLGETAFLRWIYNDLASPDGGLPELFSVQPAELALPSDERSRALINFWRHRDADSGVHWSFAKEHFEGELMGDLYQELDPVVKDRFALCQTPDFVRSFILDRTLTPAIETFGADKVRLLDPACGSGHFLIDGLKRLAAATASQHSDWPRPKVLEHALGRVVGTDLNDYACALARARLVMTAADLAGVSTLAEAAKFHPHIYWADGLEQVERDEVKPSLQYGLFEKVEDKPRATLTRADVRVELRKMFAERFHAVVANPPYILERDEARKSYHREKIGKNRRYLSAAGKYSLASPFTERCFQLAQSEGFVGIIASNNFIKRDFGKPLVELILANLDISLIIDSSQAYIPHHGTPTVLIFGSNRKPIGATIRTVMGKRGESELPPEPAKGQVWQSIVEGWSQAGFNNDYLSVADLPRTLLTKHPWSLGGGGASELKERLEKADITPLGQICTDIGFASFPGIDDAFIMPRDAMLRLGVPVDFIKPFITGESLRDWVCRTDTWAIAPYDSTFSPASEQALLAAQLHFWKLRSTIRANIGFGGKTRGQAGEPHWTWYRWIPNRFKTPLSITFAFVATHNHFVLDRGGKVFNRSAPVIKFPPATTEDEHLALLAVLNSSTACFWMKQVFHDKGGGTDKGKWQSDPAKVAYEFTGTGLEKFPLPPMDIYRPPLTEHARAIDRLAGAREGLLNTVLPDIGSLTPLQSPRLRKHITEAEAKERLLLNRQIAIQEEIDWLSYRMYGLTQTLPSIPLNSIEDSPGIPLGGRPFEIVQARGGRKNGVDGQPLMTTLPPGMGPAVVKVWDARITAIEQNPFVALIEHENYKRRWLLTPKHLAGRVETFTDRLAERLRLLLADLAESVACKRLVPFEASRIASDLLEDTRFGILAEIWTDKRDYSHDRLVAEIIADESAPNHAFHRYSKSGLIKHRAWGQTWEDQRREDAGEVVTPLVPPPFAQPDFISRRIFELRGKLDIPRERYIAFTEVPGRDGVTTLYGWAGWTPLQRLKALLAIDEDLEDAGTPLADRIGVLDSAWRLLPDVARDDSSAAARLKAELQALVGPTGPSPESLEDWRKRFPPPKPPKKKTERARKTPRAEEDDAP